MKALSIRQPWAWLIVAGFKDVENRGRLISYRGPLLIHAAIKLDPTPIGQIERTFGVPINPDDLQFGGVIGRANLVDVVTNSTSPWFIGPYGWVLSDPEPRAFRRARGQLGLFDLPDPA